MAAAVCSAMRVVTNLFHAFAARWGVTFIVARLHVNCSDVIGLQLQCCTICL